MRILALAVVLAATPAMANRLPPPPKPPEPPATTSQPTTKPDDKSQKSSAGLVILGGTLAIAAIGSGLMFARRNRR